MKRIGKMSHWAGRGGKTGDGWHITIFHKEKSNKMQQCIRIFIIPYLYEAQHVSGDTPPIIRSLKLHWQSLVFHTWKVVWTCSWWTLSGTVCAWQRPPTTCPAAAHLLRTWVRIPPGAWIFVCCECRVLSGRGLCDELITRPEESYRLCSVVVCDLETSRIGAPYIYIYIYIWH